MAEWHPFKRECMLGEAVVASQPILEDILAQIKDELMIYGEMSVGSFTFEHDYHGRRDIAMFNLGCTGCKGSVEIHHNITDGVMSASSLPDQCPLKTQGTTVLVQPLSSPRNN